MYNFLPESETESAQEEEVGQFMTSRHIFKVTESRGGRDHSNPTTTKNIGKLLKTNLRTYTVPFNTISSTE